MGKACKLNEPKKEKKKEFLTVGEACDFFDVFKQVNHCRLRLVISNINYDLFRRHLLDDPVCSCGYTAETFEHFLLRIRNKTINKIDENEKTTTPIHFCFETTSNI